MAWLWRGVHGPAYRFLRWLGVLCLHCVHGSVYCFLPWFVVVGPRVGAIGLLVWLGVCRVGSARGRGVFSLLGGEWGPTQGGDV